MDSKKFMFEIELRLTALSPEMIPGVLKKQLEVLGVTSDEMTPELAKKFIENTTEVLCTFIGPEDSNNARKLMMRKLRQSCTPEELEALMVK
jgi:hypothetical protein